MSADGLPIQALGPRFEQFLRGLERPVVFFDTETTGTDPVHDRIVEISLLRIEPPDRVLAPRTWRINPEMRVPREASAVHGIQNEDLADAPKFAEVAAEIASVLENADLAGFAISRFDVRILRQEMQRARQAYDPGRARLLDAQIIFHRREPRDLGAALQFYCQREHVGAHGARADTLASLEVFAGQLARYDDLALSMDALHEFSAAQNAGFVDAQRRFVWRDDEPTFNFGKLKGRSLRWAAGEPSEREYLRWIVQGQFEDEVREIVSDALAGKIRRRPTVS